jgi:hypothetical protein
VSGRDKRGPYLRCSRMVETGLCDNKRTIALSEIETRVLQGIANHLGSPEFIAEYVREYHRAWAKLRDSTSKHRAGWKDSSPTSKLILPSLSMRCWRSRARLSDNVLMRSKKVGIG